MHATAARGYPRAAVAAALIAAGLSNAEIGERLMITPGTAANHVEAILRGLGCRTRTQAAVWAVTHGLVAAAPPPAPSGAGDSATEAAL